MRLLSRLSIHHRIQSVPLTVLIAVLGIIACDEAACSGITADEAEYFEKHIRPVLSSECYECHSGPVAANQTGLRVDVAAGLITGGGSGPSIVPGKPEESLLIKAFRYDGTLRMPPGGKLSDETIARFEEWIRMGAPDPRTGNPDVTFGVREIDWASEGAHWAYQRPREREIPKVAGNEWPRSDADHFILAKIEQAELRPAEDAEPEVWLRRVSLDLIGLPPTPEQLAEIAADSSADARAKIVDRLLASPQFGERWGRHWLDVARYGESTGKERNFVYLQAWRYRDYVIDSFNRDKPFDQFLKEQIAGDLLPYSNDIEKNEHRIATGFLALNPKGLNDRNRESFLLDIVDEQIESIGRGVLALSVTCARCHDHKYDAISQRDYFALGGIFRSTEPRFGMLSRTRFASDPEQLIPLEPTEQTRAEKFPAELVAEFLKKEAEQEVISAKLVALRDQIVVEPPPIPSVQSVIAAAETAAARKKEQSAPAPGGRRRRTAEPKNETEKSIAELENQMRTLAGESTALQKQIAAVTTHTAAIGLMERPSPADLAIRIKGEVDQRGPTVARGFLTALQNDQTPSIGSSGSGRRELAEWIASPHNPLTARVYVNRVWSKLLGAGIVATVDDFGVQGDPPTHPELLDHLTLKFIQQGWSTKTLIREIVLSRVYGLSSQNDSRSLAEDPGNQLLSRWNVRRLEAEVLRDAILAIGGNLNLERPYGTPLTELGVRELSGRFDDQILSGLSQHRSVYLPYIRSRVPEMLTLFDGANPGLTVGRRDVSAGPDQALFLMNSSLLLDESNRFAQRLLSDPAARDADRIELAFRTALGYQPAAEQKDRALKFIDEHRGVRNRESAPGVVLTGAVTETSSTDRQLDAWTLFCQTLLIMPEFRYLN